MLVPVSAIVGFFTSIILVVWFVAQTLKHRADVRAQQVNKLLDKFGTADEFITFAQSEAGGELLDTISGGRTDQRPQVMRSIHRGIIASALGLGGVVVGGFGPPDMVWAGVLGGLLLALGVGFLVSAFVARRLGEDGDDTVSEEQSTSAQPQESLGLS